MHVLTEAEDRTTDFSSERPLCQPWLATFWTSSYTSFGQTETFLINEMWIPNAGDHSDRKWIFKKDSQNLTKQKTS